MKKYLLIVCSLFFLFTIDLSAQIPGYLGKRFSIGYSNYFMLSGIGPTANAPDADINIGMNTTHCFNIEYTIKKRTNFCLSFQSGKTGVDPKNLYAYVYDPYNHTRDNATLVTYSEQPYKPMQVETIGAGLGFKFFQSGALAPIGKYKKLELLLLFNHLTYKSDGFSYYDNGQRVYTKLGTGDYQFSTFAITYTMGRSRVLFDMIVLDYGIRFGAVPSGVVGFLNQNGNFLSDSGTQQDLDNETRFKYQVNRRLFRSQLFNFHIGLGFLAF